MGRTTTLLHLPFLLVALLALAACGPPRRQWQPDTTTTTTTGGGPVAGTGVVASGTPREQLDQLDGALRGRGFAPVQPVVHGDLQPNGLLAYAIDALPGSCYAVAVIGEVAGQNIDVILLDPLGRPAGHHVRPDNHPWVSFCAGTAGRFIARVQMVSGAGGYFYAPYVGAGGQRMELATFFGDPPEEQVQVATMDGATQQRLGALDQQLQARGFARLGEPAGLVLDGPSPRAYQLSLSQGQCYAFAALGGTGVEADLELDDAGGQVLSQDGTQGQDALLEYCAPATGSYALQVRLSQGRGSLFTVGYTRTQGQAAPTQPVMSTTSTAGAGLEENFALLDADMRARGYEGFGDRTTGELQQGGDRTYPLELEGGRCYAVLAVGDAGVRDLDLRLVASNAREVDRDIANDPRPTVRVCPRTSGRYEMHVQVAAGGGRYVYAAYRWPRGTHGPFGMEGITWVRMSEVTALLSVEGYAPDPGFTPGHGRLRSQGANGSHDVTFTSGQCYAVVVVGGEGVNDLDVTLSRAGSELATDFGSRNAFPSVRHCATADAAHAFRVTAANGSGEYHYQIFSRSEGAQ